MVKCLILLSSSGRITLFVYSLEFCARRNEKACVSLLNSRVYCGVIVSVVLSARTLINSGAKSHRATTANSIWQHSSAVQDTLPTMHHRSADLERWVLRSGSIISPCFPTARLRIGSATQSFTRHLHTSSFFGLFSFYCVCDKVF